MAEIRFTIDALEDIDEIHAYISLDSTRYADRQVQRFYAEIDRLQRFPNLGRVVPDLQDHKIRELIVGDYRIMYRILKEDMVEILIVMHGAREFPNNRFR